MSSEKTLRWARGREGCSDSPLPTSGLHPPRNGKGAARPFQTPKRKSNRKKSSRFANDFFSALHLQPLSRCGGSSPQGSGVPADAVYRYGPSREKVNQKSPQAFLICN